MKFYVDGAEETGKESKSKQLMRVGSDEGLCQNMSSVGEGKPESRLLPAPWPPSFAASYDNSSSHEALRSIRIGNFSRTKHCLHKSSLESPDGDSILGSVWGRHRNAPGQGYPTRS
jgi:hypothetical protein